jgi:hypothetical protein
VFVGHLSQGACSVNARNDLFVAAVTFVATVFVAFVAWTLLGANLQPPPVVESLPIVRDTSHAVRTQPGRNARQGIELSAARTRIAVLEKALQSRDSRYAAARKEAQRQRLDGATEREQLSDTVALLERALRLAVAAENETADPVSTPPDNNVQTTLTSIDEPVDFDLDPTGTGEEIGEELLRQAQNDYQQLKERLDEYIAQLNQSNQRVSAAARQVVVQAGQDAIEPIILLLDSQDPAVQLWALVTLKEMGPIASEASEVVKTLRNHPVPEVTQAAAAALRAILD